MNLVFIAPPAAGKGTISIKLKEEYGFTHISAGELLRNVEPSSSVYEEVQDVMKKGGLVKGNIIISLLKERLLKNDITKGFILDGFPRNLDQTFAFGELLKEIDTSIDKVIYLDVDINTALKRVLGRRSCPKCKRDYNVLTKYNTPKNDTLCDDCHIPLEKRSDDNEESFIKRYETYMTQTKPVIKFFEDLNILVKIDSSGEMEDTYNELVRVLGLEE